MMAIAFKMRPIGDYVQEVSSWNPQRDGGDEEICYLDLSSVSQQTKTIENHSPVLAKNAPSRARQLVRSGDILVSTVRPNLNGVARVPDSFDGATASTGFCVLRPDRSKLLGEYLLHWVKTPAFILDMTRNATGASYPAVSDRIIHESLLPLPPLAEQQRIAAILDEAEALRVERRQALAKLDTLTHSLFLEVFGDPVTNPKRWPRSTVGDQLAFHLYGPRFYNEAYVENGVRIVRITDLDEAGTLDFSKMPRLSVSEEDIKKYALQPGDLIFARSGATVGKVALISKEDPVCIAGAYFIMMRFKDTIAPAYARGVLTVPSIQAIVWQQSQQSAQQNFSGPGLRALPMPIPPLELQKKFASQLCAVQELKTKQQISRSTIDALFASLQHRAFRGEL